MVNRRFSRKRQALLKFAGMIIIVFVLNWIARFVLFRIDLTGDKRYTLSASSKQVMQQLDQHLMITVFLDGDMPIEMKKLRTTIKETMDELKVHAGPHLRYEFVNIVKETNPKDLDRVYSLLQNLGLSPVIMQENAPDGSRSERILFPGALVTYTRSMSANDNEEEVDVREAAINFLQNNADANTDESLLIAQQNVETALVSTIARIMQKNTPRIAFIEGHGELDEYETGDICKELASAARLDRVIIDGRIGALDNYHAVIIAKPMLPWSEADKLVLDQYIMGGGRVAWFIDEINVHHDSLAVGGTTFALACQHQLEDQLFKYGVRINPNVISDLQCAFLPVNIAPSGQTADFKPAPWTYYPLLTPAADNAITSGLNLILSKYPSSIDTVGKNSQTAKTVLLHSSQYSRTQTIPVWIDLAQTTQRPDPEAFRQSFLPAALLLEGTFQSAFLNRPVYQYNHQQAFTFRKKSSAAKIIVVADGDIIRNDVIRRPDGTRILPLGFDRYMNVQFGNRNFVKNCIYYLLDDGNTMQIRPREWTLRVLNKAKIYPQRNYWVGLNTILPIALVLVAGIIFTGIRKQKYGRRNIN